MKFSAAAIVASILFLQVSALPAVDAERRTENTCGNPTVPLLRAYNAKRTDHFYTASVTQMEAAITHNGYKSEGDAATGVFTSQVPNSFPFYRLLNTNKTDHFYTTSTTQRDNAINSHGYHSEGITAYVYETAECGSVPLYRMYNPTIVDHFYTTSAAEKQTFITKQGYVDEGIAAYVNPTQ